MVRWWETIRFLWATRCPGPRTLERRARRNAADPEFWQQMGESYRACLAVAMRRN